MKKTVRYLINRKMHIDYFINYNQIDQFNDLKTARTYLKKLIKLINAQNEVKVKYNNSFKDAIEKHILKYGQKTGDEYLSVENKITREIKILNTVELKGI